MSDTPRTDAVYAGQRGHGFEMCLDLYEHAKSMELELAEACRQRDQYRAERDVIARLSTKRNRTGE